MEPDPVYALSMIYNIQILRAFAALNVVLYHIIPTANYYSQSTTIFTYLEGWGANGVDIFFVISGFVMLHTQLDKRKSPSEFFRNRVIRIVPIYWALTLFIIGLYTAMPGLFRHMVVTPLWSLSSLMFASMVLTGETPIVFVGWTLEWEMFFYTVFALALFAKSMRTVVGLVSLALGAIAVTTQNWIALEFIFGMGVAYIYSRWQGTQKQGLALLAAGSVLLCLSLLPAVQSLEVNRMIIWGLPSFVVVLGAIYAPQAKGRILSYLGDASYSIYLVQMLSITAFYKVSSKILVGVNGDLLALACLFSSATLGCAMYSFIEKPMTQQLKRHLMSRRECS
jgi:peptidoglycan/LPS O-acetylase OafA/YrhL